jgi:F-type H+-transporting ATPase subunit gamma
MPALKDIKRRIKSVKSTQKITQAMYMISTTKLKKAENRVKIARPFSYELLNTFKRVMSQNVCLKAGSVEHEHAIENYPALIEQRDVKNVALIVVGSNKGLSGPYVTNVVRQTLERAHQLEEQNIHTKLFIIGQRSYNALKRSSSVEIIKLYNNLNEIVTPSESSVIAEDVAEAYVHKKVDKIEILTTEYVSRMSNSPKLWPLLPIELPKYDETDHQGPMPEMVFEPNLEEILQSIIPLYMSNRIYQALLEAYASELSSRMTAMKSATDNADEMIDTLTLKYNKERQASITQEILEVVSGADAQRY